MGLPRGRPQSEKGETMVRIANRLAGTLSVVAMLGLLGCVDVHQTLYMQHDGSGRLVESIRVLPRAVRLMKGRTFRDGKGAERFALLSDEAVQRRLKACGALTLVKKEVAPLKDGSIRLKAEYTFKDVNKINLWIAPTFKCNDPKRTGKFTFKYQRIIYIPWHKKHYKADQMTFSGGSAPARKKYSSPYALKEFEHVAPVFQDMLRNFRLRIEVVAPIEDFGDGGAVWGAPSSGNRMVLLNIQGANVSGSREIIKQFIAGEVGGRADAWGGTWKKMEDRLPDTYTPYACGYSGLGCRFLKLAEVPAPGGAKKK